ncbi:MAG: cell division ATP-binding protein FtsE [Thermoanaerobaculia bacterium]
MIHFLNVSKTYEGSRVALDRVSFELGRGEFGFLTGPSGAGKTTLLRLVYRETLPDSGQVLISGRKVGALPPSKVPYLRRRIGVVFQDCRLIGRKTVFENVGYLPRVLGIGLRERRRLAYQALRRVGLAHRMRSFPPELSRGEQQRVAIARALINEPEILLADEPTGNLDPDLSREVFRVFRQINATGTTVLAATHSPELITEFGGRVLVLDRGRLVGDQRLVGRHGPDYLQLVREEPPRVARRGGL